MTPTIIAHASTWGGVQDIVLAVMAIMVTITTALVGLQIGTVRTLRESNRDLRDRVADLEKERLEDRAEIVERDGRIAEKDSEISLLRAMVTGKVEWIAVTDQLEGHSREALTHWKATEERLDEILTALRETP